MQVQEVPQVNEKTSGMELWCKADVIPLAKLSRVITVPHTLSDAASNTSSTITVGVQCPFPKSLLLVIQRRLPSLVVTSKNFAYFLKD